MVTKVTALEEMNRLDKLSTHNGLGADSPDGKRLLALAEKDPFLGPAALKKRENLLLIYYNSLPVGFYIPFKESDGRYRIGTLYVEPKYRQKGLATTTTSNYFRNKRGRAWIEPTNSASQKTFKNSGFYKTGRTMKAESGRVFEEWINNGMPVMQSGVFGW